MGHHYEESSDEQAKMQYQLFYCTHGRSRLRIEGFGCSTSCDETIAVLRAVGILEEIRERIVAVAEKRDGARFAACINEALGLKP